MRRGEIQFFFIMRSLQAAGRRNVRVKIKSIMLFLRSQHRTPQTSYIYTTKRTRRKKDLNGDVVE